MKSFNFLIILQIALKTLCHNDTFLIASFLDSSPDQRFLKFKITLPKIKNLTINEDLIEEQNCTSTSIEGSQAMFDLEFNLLFNLKIKFTCKFDEGKFFKSDHFTSINKTIGLTSLDLQNLIMDQTLEKNNILQDKSLKIKNNSSVDFWEFFELKRLSIKEFQKIKVSKNNPDDLPMYFIIDHIEFDVFLRI